MKIIQFLKKELNDCKETISDDPWAFFRLIFFMILIVMLSVASLNERHEPTTREYHNPERVFATNKVTVTDKYFAKTSNGKGVQKRVTVKFDGRSYYISDSKLYDKAKKGDRLKGYYVYDYIWGNYCKVLYLAEGKHVRMQEEY